MKPDCIVCLGDSITWGFPYGPEFSWVNLASTALGVPMINRGINGETAADLLQRFRTDVLDRKPSHVMILVGANDASINISLASFTESLQKMYNLAVSNNIEVIFGLPVPSADKWLEFTMEKYRVWLRAFSQENQLKLVDFSQKMLDGDNVNARYYTDEVHPSKAGYQAMAEVVVNELQKKGSGHPGAA